jgi:PadR family transcriptional regulator, regulatory protein PadR
MSNSSPLPEPLTHLRFYVLLSLARYQRHGYAIQGAIYSNSLGSINIKSGSLYPLLMRMCDEGLIEFSAQHPTDKSKQPRMHYGITREGRETAGLFNDHTPLEIQRILNPF